MASTLFMQLSKRPSMETDLPNVQNFLVLKLHESQVEALITNLSVIGCWLRQSQGSSIIKKLDGKLQNDLEALVKTHLLPRICDLFDFTGSEIAIAIDAKHAKSKQVCRINEMTVYELFIQLALQTLSIYQVIHESSPKPDD